MCTVRECRRELARERARLVCPQGHSFDVARSGYINLLQPQDSRSRQPGDTAAAVSARRRLHDRGVTKEILAAISGIAGPLASDQVLDVGSGDGFYLGSLARENGFEAHGIDLSIPAAEAAARRYPECDWIVANADRFVPFADNSFSLLLSITARMNPSEFHRVLGPSGRLLIALPAPGDLIELRGLGRDRIARTLDEFSRNFKLIEQRRVTTEAHLDAAAIQDILLSIYRPLQAKQPEAMRVTFSLDLLLFEAD